MQERLKIFESISLKEMEDVKLLNRTDVKFAFSADKFELILEQIKNDYRILEINNKRISTYNTLYFDTDDFALYLKHHNGELNRYKIRERTYKDTGAKFLEVKFKSNKGRTIKERMEVTDFKEGSLNQKDKFLKNALPFDPDKLKEALWVNYKRITFVNKSSAERLTIDLGLQFINGSVNDDFNNLIIAEVKQDKKAPSVFIDTMKNLRIKQKSISKYCLGIAITHDDIKRNNFKERINSIKSILNDTDSSSK